LKNSRRPPRPASARQPPLPAKLTRPSAAGLVRRDRLFRWLDAAARQRIVWIAAPGGSGKTSLVASWLDTRGIRALWYRIDAGDADPATFFQYMRLAAHERPGAETLPPFSPAPVVALHVYARRFFEVWFALFDDAVTLVFDNYERLAGEARTDELLDALLMAMPDHARAVVLSRNGPPAGLARWEASPELATLVWDQLRFSADESIALAASWDVCDATTVAPIAHATRGWAAGIVLMARAVRAGIDVEASNGATSRGLFNYFATEIFARLPADVGRFLLRIAFLPDVTAALAQVLTGEQRAGALLADLHADHFFVDRKAQAGPASYELHPLFRDFLCAHAAQTLGAAGVDEIRCRAAAALEASGQADAAAALLVEAGDTERLLPLIEQHGEEMLRQARFATLRGWLERVREPDFERAPRMLMWRGLCEFAAGDPTWRTTIEQARRHLDRHRDLGGAFTVRVWIMLTSARVDDARTVVAELRKLVEEHWDTSSPEQQVEALAQYRNDIRMPEASALIRDLHARAARLNEATLDAEAQLWLGAFRANHCVPFGDVDGLREVESKTRPLIDAKQGSVRARANCLALASWHWIWSGTVADNRRALAELTALGDVCGFHIDQNFVSQCALRSALACRDFEAAARWEQLVRPMVRLVPFRHLLFLVAAVRLAIERGDLPAAERYANELQAHMPAQSGYVDYVPAMRAQVELARGDGPAALACLEGAQQPAAGTPRSASPLLMLVRAAAHLACGQREAAARAARGWLENSRQGGIARHFAAADRFVSQVLAFALRRQIEPAHARDLVRLLEQPAPSTDIEEWPWPIRVRVLGTPQLEFGTGAPHAARRPQKKPLELLHFIVAGGGEPVAITAAMDALWPDTDGDAAKKAFDITLHRLRKLLGTDTAVRVEIGRVRLDPQQCWVDLFAFTRIVERIEHERLSDEALDDATSRALALYRGHLLDGVEAPWCITLRDRLRGRFTSLAERAGNSLAASGRTDDAERCYRNALEVDPTAEAIYRRWMVLLAGGAVTAAAPRRRPSSPRASTRAAPSATPTFPPSMSCAACERRASSPSWSPRGPAAWRARRSSPST
jgi:LuxR family maltose regulon positive regulatory protein